MKRTPREPGEAAAGRWLTVRTSPCRAGMVAGAMLVGAACGPDRDPGPENAGGPFPGAAAADPASSAETTRSGSPIAGRRGRVPEGPTPARALRSPDVAVRLAVLELAARPESVGSPRLNLVKRALRDPSPDVRIAAVRALVRRGSEAREALVRAVALGGEVAAQATAGLAAVVPELAGAGHDETRREPATGLWLRLLRGSDGTLHDPACAAVYLRRQGAEEWVDRARSAAWRGTEAGRIDPRTAPSCALLVAPVASGETLGRIVDRAPALRGPLVEAVGDDPERLAALAEGPLANPAAAWALARTRGASFPPLGEDAPAALLRMALDGFLFRPALVPDTLLERGMEHRDRAVRCAAARVRDRRRGWPGDVERCGLGDPGLVALWNAEAVRAGVGAADLREGWRDRTANELPKAAWVGPAWRRLWDENEDPLSIAPPPASGDRWSVSYGAATFEIDWDPGPRGGVPLVPGARIHRAGPYQLVIGDRAERPPSPGHWAGYHRRIHPGSVFTLPGAAPSSVVLVLAIGPVPPANLAGARRVGRVPQDDLPALRAIPSGSWVRRVSRETRAPGHQSTSSRKDAP